tara:strand:- start:362 stop:568 length:207 start_codon:yes stop_codon:yes gene_type:complete
MSKQITKAPAKRKNKMHVRKVRKVVKGLKKASKLHKEQAKSLGTLLKNKRFKSYGKKKRPQTRNRKKT